VLVGDRQRVAVEAIAGAEVALEVGGPEIIGLRGGRWHDPGVLVAAPPPPVLDQSAAGQEIPGRADGGQVRARMPRPEPVQELGGSPARMLPTGGADQGRDLLGDPVRARMRAPAAILQPLPARVLEPPEPLVAGLPADAGPRAELDHRVQVQPVIADEPLSLLHG